jgi:hypothetical protein
LEKKRFPVVHARRRPAVRIELRHFLKISAAAARTESVARQLRERQDQVRHGRALHVEQVQVEMKRIPRGDGMPI